MTTIEAPLPRSLPARRPRRRRPWAPAWVLPTALILLSLVPMSAGSLRLASLAGAVDVGADLGAPPTPVPALVAHIVGITVYVLLGALQFHRGLRRRRPRWHRIAGRVTVPAGVLASVSGIWLTLAAVGPGGNGALVVVRIAVGVAMVAALVLGVLRALGRDLRAHRAWMVRAYALGQGAGTHVFVLVGGEALLGGLTHGTEAALFALGWAINVAVGEWAIRRW